MSFSVYKLELSFKDPIVEDKISEYFELDGRIMDEKWSFEGMHLDEDDEWIDYITLYHDAILKNKKKIVEKYGNFDVAIFLYYEFENQQCNMEFWPKHLSKLNELGCTLHISCWDESVSDNL